MEDMILLADVIKKLDVSSQAVYDWDKAGKITVITESPHVRYITIEEFNRLKNEMLPKGMKKCKYCNFIGEQKDFAKGRKRCVECHKEYEKNRRLRNIDKLKLYDRERYNGERREKQLETAASWYHNNKDRVKDKQLERLYGISIKEFEEMKNRCNNKCEICKNSTDKLCVDHNHETGQVRGLLCTHCNSVIGYCRESKDILLTTIGYLDRYNKIESIGDV